MPNTTTSAPNAAQAYLEAIVKDYYENLIGHLDTYDTEEVTCLVFCEDRRLTEPLQNITEFLNSHEAVRESNISVKTQVICNDDDLAECQSIKANNATIRRRIKTGSILPLTLVGSSLKKMSFQQLIGRISN